MIPTFRDLVKKIIYAYISMKFRARLRKSKKSMLNSILESDAKMLAEYILLSNSSQLIESKQETD